MKTVQMTLDEGLVRAVDQTVKRLKTTRSAFARRALQDALEKVHLSELEEKQREGYRKKPVTRGEFSDWESEQAWGDE
jgi:metal-responsive CopG/Arc/MetJ family transcriptional regulator